MRFAILLSLILFCCLLSSQVGWQAKIYVNPFIPRLGTSIEREGLNIYESTQRKKWQKEVGIQFSREIGHLYQIGFGINLKDIHYNLSTNITSPIDPSKGLKNVKGHMSLVVLGPCIKVGLKMQNLLIEAGIEINIPVSRSSSFEEIDESIVVFVPPDSFGGLLIYAHPSFNRLSGKFILPDLQLSYGLTSSWMIHIGVKLKPYGDHKLYTLKVDGVTSYLQSNEIQVLQETYIYNRLVMPYFGLSYRIDLCNKLQKRG